MAGVSTVLDFGGGCGLHYKLAARQTPNVRWAVVETPAMVRRASELSDDRALQYIPDPLAVLKRLCGLRAIKMFWERVLFSEAGTEKEFQSSFLGDNGPGSISIPKEKIVKYARTRIPEADFLAAHRGGGGVQFGGTRSRLVPFLIEAGQMKEAPTEAA